MHVMVGRRDGRTRRHVTSVPSPENRAGSGGVASVPWTHAAPPRSSARAPRRRPGPQRDRQLVRDRRALGLRELPVRRGPERDRAPRTGVGAAAACCSVPLAGVPIDRIGPKRVLMIADTLAAVVSLMFLFAGSFPVLVALGGAARDHQLLLGAGAPGAAAAAGRRTTSSCRPTRCSARRRSRRSSSARCSPRVAIGVVRGRGRVRHRRAHVRRRRPGAHPVRDRAVGTRTARADRRSRPRSGRGSGSCSAGRGSGCCWACPAAST